MLAVGVGAALGAWLRWGLGALLNAWYPAIPPGTLVANLAGGYLVGIAVAFFAGHAGVAPEWRLFAITGFLGGLTTFSTFSAEGVALLQQARYAAAFAHSAMHLIGSFGATLAGIATWRLVAT
ncbi:MAG: fluoride efflux transporter CrcB [Burkholderiales bacterium]|nr:fluoride efflux transporter CrcB [Burkholderiales bacterium]